jgi:hypothetical protein
MIIEYIGKASRIYRRKKIKRIFQKMLHDPIQSARIMTYMAGRLIGFSSPRNPL